MVVTIKSTKTKRNLTRPEKMAQNFITFTEHNGRAVANLGGRLYSIVSAAEVDKSQHRSIAKPARAPIDPLSWVFKSQFDLLLDELYQYRLRKERERTQATFHKAHSAPAPRIAKKPRPIPVIFRRTRPAPAQTVAKAFDALNHSDTLNADERGRLMLGLASLTDRVFAKAEPCRR